MIRELIISTRLAKIVDTGALEILFHRTPTECTRDNPTPYIDIIQTVYNSIKPRRIIAQISRLVISALARDRTFFRICRRIWEKSLRGSILNRDVENIRSNTNTVKWNYRLFSIVKNAIVKNGFFARFIEVLLNSPAQLLKLW